MKEKLVVLIDLQALETEAGHVQSAVDAAPKEMEALNATLLQFQKKISEEAERIEGLKKEYRSREADVETNLTRIRKSKERMDSVKNNKEYQSLQKEIDGLEAQNSVIEDDMILSLDQIESGETAIKRLKVELVRMEADVVAQKDAIAQKTEQGKQRLSELGKKRDDLYNTVDPKILETYEQVKKRVKSAALVPVSHAVCKGCHLMIPPQMFNELQRWESLKFCPHCHRMIYWLEDQ